MSGVLGEYQGGWCGGAELERWEVSKGYKEPKGYRKESEMQRERLRQGD